MVTNEKTSAKPPGQAVQPFRVRQMMVALELGLMDNLVLDYLDLFTSHIPVASAYCLHVMPKFDLFHHRFESEMGSLISNYELNQEVIASMERRLKEHPINKNIIRMEYDVKEGDPLEELLLDAADIRADLIVIGQRGGAAEHGIVAHNFARKVEANALIVPETHPLRLKKILVPIDFSPNSIEALNAAIGIAKRLDEDVEVTVLNVFEMPNLSVYKIQRSREELTRMLMEDRQNAIHDFLNQYEEADTRFIRTEVVEKDLPGIARYICDYGMENDFDLIVIGAKGHSRVERLLLGSVTEKLLNINEAIPTLVIK